jgi:hypothetical protein
MPIQVLESADSGLRGGADSGPGKVPLQILGVPIRPGTWPVLVTEGVRC